MSLWKALFFFCTSIILSLVVVILPSPASIPHQVLHFLLEHWRFFDLFLLLLPPFLEYSVEVYPNSSLSLLSLSQCLFFLHFRREILILRRSYGFVDRCGNFDPESFFSNLMNFLRYLFYFICNSSPISSILTLLPFPVAVILLFLR